MKNRIKQINKIARESIVWTKHLYNARNICMGQHKIDKCESIIAQTFLPRRYEDFETLGNYFSPKITRRINFLCLCLPCRRSVPKSFTYKRSVSNSIKPASVLKFRREQFTDTAIKSDEIEALSLEGDSHAGCRNLCNVPDQKRRSREHTYVHSRRAPLATSSRTCSSSLPVRWTSPEFHIYGESCGVVWNIEKYQGTRGKERGWGGWLRYGMAALNLLALESGADTSRADDANS